MNQDDYLKLDPTQNATMMLAMHIRNNLEDFHVKHLNDKQMKELNQTIRQSLYNWMSLADRIAYKKDTKKDEEYLTWTRMMIPKYWEVPTEDKLHESI